LTRDPFTILGVTEEADDAEIRRRYLTLVREYPPDRAPERFQELRAAYDALSDERKRLETTLLHDNAAALAQLSRDALRSGSANTASACDHSPDAPAPRATQRTIMALLAEGIARVLPDPTSESGGR
jgi:DnaJ-class molecular chaperone